MEPGVKYKIESGNICGEYCKYVIMEGNLAPWNDDHARALVSMIIPHM